jgi:hypothetical protein
LEEVARFSQLNNNIKHEISKKKSLLDHKSEAEKDLKKAVE